MSKKAYKWLAALLTVAIVFSMLAVLAAGAQEGDGAPAHDGTLTAQPEDTVGDAADTDAAPDAPDDDTPPEGPMVQLPDADGPTDDTPDDDEPDADVPSDETPDDETTFDETPDADAPTQGDTAPTQAPAAAAADDDDDDGDDPGEPGGSTERWDVSLWFIEDAGDGSDNRVGGSYTTDLSDKYYSSYGYNFQYDRDAVVKLQINYQNSNLTHTYSPGQVTITVPNPFYGLKDDQIVVDNISVSTVINTGSTQGKPGHWQLQNGDSDLRKMENFVFENIVTFDGQENFSGSIQIVFNVNSVGEAASQHPLLNPKVERFEDDCLHKMSATLQAVMDAKSDGGEYEETHTSDELQYTFQREYYHPWKEYPYTLKKTAKQVTSVSGFLAGSGMTQEEYDNYYWVRWDIAAETSNEADELEDSAHNYWHYIFAKKLKITDDFPEGCLVYDGDGKLMQKDADGHYSTDFELPYYQHTDIEITRDANGYFHWYIIVGYPKETYGPETGKINPIVNTADLDGIYITKEDYEDFTTATGRVDLGDFDFKYTGDLYAISKQSTSTDTKYYQYLTGDDPNLNKAFTYRLTAIALYEEFEPGPHDENHLTYNVQEGYGMDVVIGDDYLYVSDVEGGYRRLQDSEYYFAKIDFPGTLYGQGGPIEADKYTVELYVRRAGSDKYEQWKSSFTNKQQSEPISFEPILEDVRVVGYYFVIREVKESLAGDLYYWDDGSVSVIGNGNFFTNTVVINDAKAALTQNEGNVYNFDYIKVYLEKQDNDRWGQQGWINQPGLDSYVQGDGFNTAEEIAPQDMETHGGYVQRDRAVDPYEDVADIAVQMQISAEKSLNIDKTYNVSKRGWSGSAAITLQAASSRLTTEERQYIKYIPDEKWVLGWEMHDLLPEYMELTSTAEEIKNSMVTASASWLGPLGFGIVYGRDGEILYQYGNPNIDPKPEVFINEIKRRTSVEVIENYQGTNRTYIGIVIDFSDMPFVAINTYSGNYGLGSNVFYDDITFKYNFFYHLEGYLEHGTTVANQVLVGFHDREGVPYLSRLNGDRNSPFLYRSVDSTNNTAERHEQVNLRAVQDWGDINDNGDTEEWFTAARDSKEIEIAEGTYQSISKEVAAEGYAFNTDWAKTTLGGDYQYRLTIRTGNSYLDDIILYDDIEEWYMDPDGDIVESGDGTPTWSGTFAGVHIADSTYEDNPYLDEIKIYYSSNAKTEPLYDTAGEMNAEWHPYDPATTDVSKVHSLAFEFIKKADTDKDYTLAEDSKVAITIDMKAPHGVTPDAEFAHNGAWTSWTANNADGGTIHGSDGMNSNTVKVYLPESDPPQFPETGSAQLVVLCCAAAVLAAAGLALYPRKKQPRS